MSTKIYNAYKINNMTMTEIMVELYKLKELRLKSIMEFVKKVNKERILEKYDFNSFYSMLRDVNEKNKNSSFNWNSSAVVYFYQDNIYIIFFGCDFFDWKDTFGENLVDYHYQDQSDAWYCFSMDEDTDEYKQAEIEWNERENVWNHIIGERYKFSESGLSYDIFSKDDVFSLAGKIWMVINDK